jgi:hypothetical protein
MNNPYGQDIMASRVDRDILSVFMVFIAGTFLATARTWSPPDFST